MLTLKTIATGSKGNSYALTNGNEILLLDLGVSDKEIKKAINYRVSDIVGCLVTHGHIDHAKSVKDFENMGIPVFKAYEYKENVLNRWFGNLQVSSFDLPHNGTENRGFLIRTLDNQKILYLTDFEYCRYCFENQKVNHIICECNYQQELVDRDLPQYEHKIKGHCSLETCKNFIIANKTNALRNVILCHLGAETTIADECVAEVHKVANCPVYAAEKGKEIELSLYPF